MKRLVASGESPNWKKPFFIVWGGQAVSLMGSYLVQFALVWYLTRTTGSATILATSSLVALLPQIVLGPFAGALVDRWNRRYVMIAADLLTALTTLGLVVLFWLGLGQVWHVYVAMAIRSLGMAFQHPAETASTSLMVPKEQLTRVAGLNQGLSGALNVIAPPFGALLMEALPLHQVLAVDIITALVAIVPLLFILIPQPKVEPGAEKVSAAGVFKDVREGFGYIRRWPGVMGVILMAMGLNLIINPVFRLMPLLVTEHFHGGALEFGWTDSAWGLGIVAGGLLLGAWGGLKNRVVMALLAFSISGVGFSMVGFAPGNMLWVALVALFLTAILNSIGNGSFAALLQEHIDPGMQGRVFTVVSSGCMLMVPIGMAVVGPLADAVSVRVLMQWAGFLQILLGLVTLAFPAVRNLEKNGPKARGAVMVPEPSAAGPD